MTAFDTHLQIPALDDGTSLVGGETVLPTRPQETAIPPLENGDHLTRAEFKRRYDAMPELKKAELIEGIVYMASPVFHKKHGRPHFQIMGWLARYEDSTPGTEGGDNSSLELDLDNMPQPDAFLLIPPQYGGQTTLSEEDYIQGRPELVVEVATSSVSYDLHSKLNVYRRNGVREYIVWRARERAIDWFVLRKEVYERLQPGEDGIYRSEIFPGLWLDPEALIRDDMPRVYAVLRQGAQTPEHSAFTAQLRERFFSRPEVP